MLPRRPQRPELTRCSSGSTSSSRPAPRRPSPPASAVGHPTCVPALTARFRLRRLGVDVGGGNADRGRCHVRLRCSPAADAAVVTAEGTTEPLIAALEDEGGYVLDANECDRLRDLLAGDGTELSSPVGNSPRWFASTLDLPPAADATAFLIVAGENLASIRARTGSGTRMKMPGMTRSRRFRGFRQSRYTPARDSAARAAGGRAGRITCRCGPHDARGAGPAGRGGARSADSSSTSRALRRWGRRETGSRSRRSSGAGAAGGVSSTAG